MKYTINYGLKKMEGSDEINIKDFSENMDKIDELIFELEEKIRKLEEETDKLKNS